MTQMQALLSGIRVLDLSRILAGPLAAQNLADLGAAVLKIERPDGGDDTRHWGPPFVGEDSAYFLSANRNKSSLTLDFKVPSERAFLGILLKKADIVIDNFPDDVRVRLGLCPMSLLTENPRLIHVGIRSFSKASTRSQERGYDVVLQAESGFMELNGKAQREGGEGYKVGVAIVDVLCAQMAAQAALAALYRRSVDGRGRSLDVSLYQSAMYGLVNVATNASATGKPTQRYGNAHANLVPYQDFQCRDRRVVIAAANDDQFRRLVDILELPDHWKHSDSAERVVRRAELVDVIQMATQNWESTELIAELRRAKLACAVIVRPDEALRQPWTQRVAVELSQGNTSGSRLFDFVQFPIESDEVSRTYRAPPRLNEGGAELARQWIDGVE